MGVEGELLREIQDALRRANLDADAVVEEAWQAARGEVSAVLQRVFQHELLSRAAQVVADGSAQFPPSSDPAHDQDAGRDPGADPPPVRPVEASAEPAEASEPAPEQGLPPLAPERPATYVFGITRASFDLDDDLPAIGGGRVRSVDAEGLRAVVCDADADVLQHLAELGPDDVEQLAVVANEHEDVLLGVAARAPILPIRLGTMLHDDEVVQALLTANAGALHAELDRIEGHAEWAVVVRLERGEPAEPEDLNATSGADYLRQRQNALAARADRWEARDELTSDLHERLSALAVEAETVENRPLEETSPDLHGVYLLTWGAIERFQRAVSDAQAAHPEAVIEATGPLPPYHFTSVDLGLDREVA